jgi:hypothetical protein
MTEPLPVAEFVHGIESRSRLRISSRRGDAAFFTAIAGGLSAHPGVSAVEVSPMTGSVLIRHFVPFEEIVAVSEKAGLFRVGEGEARAVPLSPPEWPKLSVEPKLAIAMGLGLIALWQLAKGKTLPPALTLIWYAARVAGLGPGGHSLDEAE